MNWEELFYSTNFTYYKPLIVSQDNCYFVGIYLDIDDEYNAQKIYTPGSIKLKTLKRIGRFEQDNLNELYATIIFEYNQYHQEYPLNVIIPENDDIAPTILFNSERTIRIIKKLLPCNIKQLTWQQITKYFPTTEKGTKVYFMLLKTKVLPAIQKEHWQETDDEYFVSW